MMTRLAAVAVAAVLGAAAPVASATAFPYAAPTQRVLPVTPYDGWSAYPGERPGFPAYGSCPASSASEGNANQQTRPVMQYGQTSGGNRC